MSQAWEDMTDIERASALELMGGKRQANILSAIIQNFDTVEDVISTSMNSSNSALSENEKYLDSIEGRMNQFTNAVKTMWEGAIGSEFIKGIVEIGTGFIKAADGIDIFGHKIGNLWSTLAVVIPILIKTFKKMTWGEFFGSLGTDIMKFNSRIMGLSTRMAALGATATTTSAAMNTITVSTFKSALATAGLEQKDRLAILSKMGLANATKSQVIAQDQLTASTIDTMVAEGRLSIKQGETIKYLLGLKNATNEVNSARMNEILISQGLDRSQRTQIINKLGLTGATKALTREQVLQALSTSNLSYEVKQEILAELGLLSVRDKLVFTTKKFLKSMGPMLTIAAVAGAIWLVTKAIDANIETLEEAKEKLTETKNKFDEIDSELQNMKSRLEEINSAIEELSNKEALSFTDQEELQRLKAQREELERSIELSEEYKKQQQKIVNRDAQNTATQYKNANFKSGKGKEDTQQNWAIGGAIATGIIAAIGVALAPFTAGLSTLATIGAVGGSALVGAAVGGAAGYAAGTAVSEGGTDVEEAMDQMLTKRKSLEEKYNKAREEYYNDETGDEKIAERYAKAEKELSDYDSKMAEHISTLDSYYSQIDLSAETDSKKIAELRREMNAFYDSQDKWAIAQGTAGAKVNAFTRIFGENAEQEIKDAKQKYIDALNNGEEIDLEDAFGSTESYEALKQRLYDMGLYIVDAENYLKDYKDVISETAETNLDKLVSNLTAAEDALSSLSDALEEASESGQIAAKTIKELYETFGSIEGISDEWEDYINVMMSGVASTDEMIEATRKLAEAWVDEKLVKGPLNTSEKIAMISMLSRMGAENAYEYVEDAQKEAGYQAIADSIKSKMTRKSELEAKGEKNLTDSEKATLKELTEELEGLSQLGTENAQWVQDIADKYGLTTEEVQKYINKLKELAELENQLAEINNKVNKKKEIEDEKAKIDEIIAYRDMMKTKYGDFNWGETDGDSTDPESWLTAEEAYEKVIKVTPNIDKDAFIKDYNSFMDLILNNGDITELTEKKKELEAELSKLNIDPNASEEEKKNLEKKINDLKDQIEEEFTEPIKLKLELQNKSKLVDDIQSVYDTLKNAQKEYAEKGYLTVDTMQAIIELEPKYINLLYDENGQLNLNEQALLDVAKAKIIDLGITQQKAILEEALKLATEGSRESLLEYIGTIEDATGANKDFIKTQLAAIKAQLKSRTIDKEEQKTRNRRDRDGNTITETVTVITKADLSEAEADQIYKSVENSVNAVQKTVDLGIAGLPKGGLSSSGDEESALEKIQKKYERQISNLDNQKTYLQNEVDRLEAENKGISKSYYTEQIKLEEKKAKLLQQERKELTNLLNSTAKGSDDWWDIANALWEVDHAIQDSTLAIIEARKEIAALYKTAFDKLETAYENKDDIYDQRMEYIDKFAELYEIQDEEAPMSVYLAKIAETQNKQNNLLLEIADLEKAREAALADAEAGIEGGDETYDELTKTLNEKYIEYQENVNSIAEYTKNIKELQVKAFDIIRKAYDNRNDFYDDQQSYMEGYIDYLEASGVDATPEMYEKLIEIEKEKRANNVANLINARAGVEKLKAAGYTMADDELVDAEKQVRELEKAVQDNDIAIKQWEKDIQELEFEKFDKFAERVNNFNKELENVRKLIDDEDVAFEDGTWTKEGITNLAMLYHQIENNTNMIAKYNEEMAKLEVQYKAGEISESDYIERAQELKDQQWELVLSNEELKDSIIDINEARIDLVEEGINKEVDAYRELIELKRDELSAERELYEFRQDVEDQTRDIAELERKIASLSGADDAASVAERRRLEAELRDKNRDLESTYYGHAKDSQSTALDDEMEAYEKAGEDYIESLRDKLENVNLMIEQTLQEVLFNADVTFNELSTLATENNITLSQNLMAPWQKMSELATMTKDQIGVELLNLNEDSVAPFSDYAGTLLTAPFETGGIACTGFKTLASTQIAELQAQVYNASSDLLRDLSYPWTGAEAPINTFSQTTDAALQGAIVEAQAAAVKMTTSNEQPWKAGIGAAQLWSSEVEKAYDNAIKKSQEYAAQVAKEQAVSTPSYTTTKPPSSSGGDKNGSGTNAQKKEAARKAAQDYIYSHKMREGDRARWGQDPNFKKLLDVYVNTYEGSINDLKAAHGMDDYGAIDKQINIGSTAYLNQHTKHIAGSYYYYDKNSKTYYKLNDVKQKKDHGSTMHYIPVGTHRYKYYAKGTLGTKKDQWAITDEPQFGDELVLVPTAQGNLSYMRKGTSIVPADITNNLVEWGQLDPNAITSSGVGANINIINSAVNKPEIKLDIENFLRCDNVSQDALPELEKFVNEKMNNLVKQLNYGLKKFK